MKENNEIKDSSQVINNPIENTNSHNNNKQNKSNIELITNEVNDIFAEQVLIKKKNLTQKKDFFELEITILKDMIQTEKDISLLIIIQYTYPQSEPEIYCLTEFSSPNICDGRNLLFDIIKKKWQKKVHNLDYVINKLPGFFISFIESRKKNKNFIVGKFELNKLYSLDRLKELPIYFHLITHKEKKSTFKSVKTHKIITISEISFCMYEIDNNNKGYCKLIFFADLKDLISTKLENKKTEIEIKWKNLSNDKKSIKIEIISSNYENINKILLDNQKAFLNNNNESNENKEKIGIINNNNKESKEQSIETNKEKDIKETNNKSNENKIEDNINENKKELDKKKTGSVPNINIAMVEKQIIYIEKSINVGDDKPNKEQVNYLMTLYQSAVAYYSALNDDKYKDFKNKIDKLFNVQKIKDYMDYGSGHKEKEKHNNNKEGLNQTKKEDISLKEEIKNEHNMDMIKDLNYKEENKDIVQKEEIKKEELENEQREKDNIGLIDNLIQNKVEENPNDKNKIKEDSSTQKQEENKNDFNNFINFDNLENNSKINNNNNNNVFDMLENNSNKQNNSNNNNIFDIFGNNSKMNNNDNVFVNLENNSNTQNNSNNNNDFDILGNNSKINNNDNDFVNLENNSNTQNNINNNNKNVFDMLENNTNNQNNNNNNNVFDFISL